MPKAFPEEFRRDVVAVARRREARRYRRRLTKRLTGSGCSAPRTEVAWQGPPTVASSPSATNDGRRPAFSVLTIGGQTVPVSGRLVSGLLLRLGSGAEQ